MNTLREILGLLTARERRRGILVLGMVIVMALLETMGVASVMPFLAVLGDPSIVQSNPTMAFVYSYLRIENIETFLILLAAAVLSLVIVASGFHVLTEYVMNRYIEMRRHSISERLLETYLRQPYAYFLNRHTGDMAKSILSEVDQLIGNVFRPGLQAIAYSVVVVAIVALLISLNPWLALCVSAVIGGLYVAIFVMVKGLLSRIGLDRVDANLRRFTTAGEALAGIKDIKLLGRELCYLTWFRSASIRFASHQATSQTIAYVPKSLIEAVAIGGILSLSIVLISSSDGVGAVLPVLGVYAFAAYRLLPAAQHIYAGVAKVRFGAAAVHHIHDDLMERATLAEVRGRAPEPLVPKFEIKLSDISFTYPNATRPALSGIDLEIPVGSTIGFVGTTGAGKTTLVDVVLGLLRPSEGALLVDGVPVTAGNLRAWQRSLGYVPQNIFLSDATVAENIALGVPAKEIDFSRVEKCGRLAQLHEFVTKELPKQYSTSVGERGVRLSGGQRQRIGIARALYHDPSVLVFDEATSALDNVTEQAVMGAVNALSRQKTIILIAHRLSTVRDCDKIVLLKDGKIGAQGQYSELAHENETFKKMIGHG